MMNKPGLIIPCDCQVDHGMSSSCKEYVKEHPLKCQVCGSDPCITPRLCAVEIAKKCTCYSWYGIHTVDCKREEKKC